MLPAGARLRHRADFTTTVRRGRRRTGPGALLTVHVLAAPVEDAVDQPALVGFVVSRAVGPAVVRNRIRRRLRHLMAARLDSLPSGSRVVIRALPASSGASSPQLGRDLERALAHAVSRLVSPATATRSPFAEQL